MYLILLRWLLHFDMNRKSFDFDRHLFCFSPPDDETCGVIVNTRSVLYTVNSWMTKKETCIWHHILLVHPVGNPFRYDNCPGSYVLFFFATNTHTPQIFWFQWRWPMNNVGVLQYIPFRIEKKKTICACYYYDYSEVNCKYGRTYIPINETLIDFIVSWPGRKRSLSLDKVTNYPNTYYTITVSVIESSWHMALWWNCFWTGKLQIRMLVWLSNELVNSQSSAGVF